VSDPSLEGYPVVVEIPVQWGEMDAYGHVNNTVFFRYFETARIAYLERCGFLDAYETDRVGAILHSTECRFRRALFYPDSVRIGARAIAVGEDRFTLEYRVMSTAQEAVAAEGTSIVVSFDYTKSEKTGLPEAVRERITQLEQMPSAQSS
jgi:acyl-CoA thioester hydrolase